MHPRPLVIVRVAGSVPEAHRVLHAGEVQREHAFDQIRCVGDHGHELRHGPERYLERVQRVREAREGGQDLSGGPQDVHQALDDAREVGDDPGTLQHLAGLRHDVGEQLHGRLGSRREVRRQLLLVCFNRQLQLLVGVVDRAESGDLVFVQNVPGRLRFRAVLLQRLAACVDQRVEFLGTLAHELHGDGIALRACVHLAEGVHHVVEDLLRAPEAAGRLIDNADTERRKLCLRVFAAACGVAHGLGDLGHGALDGIRVRVDQRRSIVPGLQHLGRDAGDRALCDVLIHLRRHVQRELSEFLHDLHYRDDRGGCRSHGGHRAGRESLDPVERGLRALGQFDAELVRQRVHRVPETQHLIALAVQGCGVLLNGVLQVELRGLRVVQLLDITLRPAVCLAVFFRGVGDGLLQFFYLVLLLQELALEDLARLGQVLGALGVALVLRLQLPHLRGEGLVSGVQLLERLFIFFFAVQLDASADPSGRTWHCYSPPRK